MEIYRPHFILPLAGATLLSLGIVVACSGRPSLESPVLAQTGGEPQPTSLVASNLPILVDQITKTPAVEAWRVRIDDAGWIPVLGIWDAKTAKVRPTTLPALAVRAQLKLWDTDPSPLPARSFLPGSTLGFSRTLESYTQDIRRLRDRWAMDPYPVSPAGEYTISRGIAQDFAALKFVGDDLALIDPVPGLTEYWRLLGPGKAERVELGDIVDAIAT